MSCLILNREILFGFVGNWIKYYTSSNILIYWRCNGFWNCNRTRRLWWGGLRNIYRTAINLSEMWSEGTQRAMSFFGKLMLILLDPTRDTDSVTIISGYSEALVHFTTRVTNYPVLEVCNLSLLPAWTLFNYFDLLFHWIQLILFRVYFLIVFILQQPGS